jgi:hypothetical protein
MLPLVCSRLFCSLLTLFASFSVLRSRGVGGAFLAVNNEETGGADGNYLNS